MLLAASLAVFLAACAAQGPGAGSPAPTGAAPSSASAPSGSGGQPTSPAVRTSASPPVVVALRPPPWNPPADPEAAIRAAGLEPLTAEGTVQHTHTALQVWYQGQRVTVPANIGIDQAAGTLSPIHTHDASGLIHVESPVRRTFTLGQFFAEWGVPLANATAWVDGDQTTDPAGVELQDRQFILVAWGAPPEPMPTSYTEGYYPGDPIPDLVPAIDLAGRPGGFASQGVSIRVNSGFAYLAQIGTAAAAAQAPLVSGRLHAFQVKSWQDPTRGALQLWTWAFDAQPDAAAFFSAYDPVLPGMTAPAPAPEVAPDAVASFGPNAAAGDGSLLGMVAWSSGPYVFELIGSSAQGVLSRSLLSSLAADAAASAGRLPPP